VPFFLLLLVGVLLLASSLITAALAVVTALFPAELAGGLGSLVTWALSLAVSVLALALLYRFLPDALIRWGDVWVGALVAALANEVAKSLVTRFIASGTGGVYQTIAGPLALMVWVFFTSQILFAGCELTRHYALIYGSRAGADD
jgi:membrane protein